MNTTQFIALLLLPISLVLSGCEPSTPKNKAVYFLMDTSGSYVKELPKAQKLSHFLLTQVNGGDFMAIAHIDSASFSDNNLIAQAQLDSRPSTSSQQKYQIKHQVDEFVKQQTQGSSYTDVSGAMLLASHYLQQAAAQQKILIVFSDFEEDLNHGFHRNLSMDMANIHVIAVNVTKLHADNRNPQRYLNRLHEWQSKVEQSGGQWHLLNDLNQLESLMTSI